MNISICCCAVPNDGETQAKLFCSWPKRVHERSERERQGETTTPVTVIENGDIESRLMPNEIELYKYIHSHSTVWYEYTHPLYAFDEITIMQTMEIIGHDIFSSRKNFLNVAICYGYMCALGSDSSLNVVHPTLPTINCCICD